MANNESPLKWIGRLVLSPLVGAGLALASMLYCSNPSCLIRSIPIVISFAKVVVLNFPLLLNCDPSNNPTMTEIIFLVADAPEVGYNAQALGESIFTQADDLESLREMVRDAVRCHFSDEEKRPQIIRLHIVRDEVLAS